MQLFDNLFEKIIERRSYLCVGLDPDIERIPLHLKDTDDPIFEFNKQIIDATLDLCVAYKPNIAFYEALGISGWQSLEKTINYIPADHFTIADAKRGDIGNTSKKYAKAFFETLNFDAITVAPYMGVDSVKPFLSFPNKTVILLALTSNEGSRDFQFLAHDGHTLYENVILKAKSWANPKQLMFVIGATHPEQFRKVRELAPEYFFLVPGVGAQGGDLNTISKLGFNDKVGLLVNSSRGILYACEGLDFATKARHAAEKLQQQMEALLIAAHFVK